MDCKEYIAEYLAAHADGELEAEELREVQAHLTGCDQCRALLPDELALKALLKARLRSVAAPGEVQAAIRAQLDRADAASVRRRWPAAVVEAFRRPRMWAPVAAAAVAIVLVIAIREAQGPPPSDLDVAVEKFTSFEKHFEPNVPSESYGSIAMEYHSHQMPAHIWNFQPIGFQLVGGRIDPMPDGRRATYTLYRGANGAVMCTRFPIHNFRVPPGSHQIRDGQYSYSYKGFSMVMTIDDDHQWICILMSRLPERQFVQDIAFLEGE